jgi:hypothetical protein
MARPATRHDMVGLFEQLLPLDPRVHRRFMFGCHCAFADGNMFLGVHGATLFLRLNPADRARIRQDHGAEAFDPLGGRPMREYVVLPDAVAHDPNALSDWIARGFAFALTVTAGPKRTRHASS